MDEKRETDASAGPNAKGGQEGRKTESLETRRQRLTAELATHRIPEAPPSQRRKDAQGFAMAVKLSSEFIAGVVVGAFLGYLFDRFLGTAPWGMIILLLLGFCAGVLNVLRSIGAVAHPTAERRPVDGAKAEDDE
jgi:ATP synthase protein I